MAKASIKKESKKVKKETVVILPDIRSTYNVGSFFRTCDGAGIDKIYLCGYTPCPIDSFQRPRKDLSKTALGAELVVPWEYNKDVKKTIKELKKEGKIIIAVEQHKRAIEYRSLLYKKEIKEKSKAFVFGNETEGLPQSVINLCDYVVDIPMRGEKESLNVSVSAGIILYSI